MTNMNPRARHDDVQHIADLLPAYVNGTLNSTESNRVQQHLLLCEACSNELATWQTLRETAQFSLASTPLPTLNTLTQVWARLEATPQPSLTQPTQVIQPLQVSQPSQPLQVSQPRQTTHWQSLLSSLLHLWLVFKRQVPLIHLSIWLATPLVILFGGGLAFYDIIIIHVAGIATNWSLPLFTTVSAAASAAFIYGEENDAGLELTLSTPTSIRLVMLCRMLWVVGYNFVLAALASTIIAVAHGGGLWQIMQMWLGPMLLLSSFTLALSMILGSWVAVLVSIILETAQAFLLDTNTHPVMIHLSQTGLWRTNPTMLLLALLFIAFATFYAPKQPRLSN